MNRCRGCGEGRPLQVLDFGNVPAPDYFPPADDPVSAAEACHRLAIELCAHCGLVQLADDDTGGDEMHGLEPQALRDQAEIAVKQVAAAGWLRGDTMLEFDSPHSGSWMPLVAEYGFRQDGPDADVVLDCFGIMHEPDQRNSFARRAEATRRDGVLLLQFQPIMTIVEHGQWNALRHGHFAYYSLTSLTRLLGAVGMSIATLWEFDLYGVTGRENYQNSAMTYDPIGGASSTQWFRDDPWLTFHRIQCCHCLHCSERRDLLREADETAPTALVLPDNGSAAQGLYAMVYSTGGEAFDADLSVVVPPGASLWWSDPRTGESTMGALRQGSAGSPPTAADWVMIADIGVKPLPAPS